MIIQVIVHYKNSVSFGMKGMVSRNAGGGRVGGKVKNENLVTNKSLIDLLETKFFVFCRGLTHHMDTSQLNNIDKNLSFSFPLISCELKRDIN